MSTKAMKVLEDAIVVVKGWERDSGTPGDGHEPPTGAACRKALDELQDGRWLIEAEDVEPLGVSPGTCGEIYIDYVYRGVVTGLRIRVGAYGEVEVLIGAYGEVEVRSGLARATLTASRSTLECIRSLPAALRKWLPDCSCACHSFDGTHQSGTRQHPGTSQDCIRAISDWVKNSSKCPCDLVPVLDLIASHMEYAHP